MPVSLNTCFRFVLGGGRLASAVGFVVFLITILNPVEVRSQDDKVQQPSEVIRVYSNLVSVPVIVSDRNGHYISGLKEEDFKLYDNSAEQKLAYFDAAEAPLNVALLLDTSRSTEGVIDDIRQAAKNFLKQLRPTMEFTNSHHSPTTAKFWSGPSKLLMLASILAPCLTTP
jgi:hypothetical protein